jgi:hypothetical protein
VSDKITLVPLLLIVAGAAIALLALREFRKEQSEADQTYAQVMRIQDRAVASRRAIATVYLEACKSSLAEWQDEVGVVEIQSGSGPLAPLAKEISAAGSHVVGELALIVSLYDGGSRDKALDQIRKSASIVYLDQAREITRKLQEIDDGDANAFSFRLRSRLRLRRLISAVAGLFCLMFVGACLLLLKSH